MFANIWYFSTFIHYRAQLFQTYDFLHTNFEFLKFYVLILRFKHNFNLKIPLIYEFNIFEHCLKKFSACTLNLIYLYFI